MNEWSTLLDLGQTLVFALFGGGLFQPTPAQNVRLNLRRGDLSLYYILLHYILIQYENRAPYTSFFSKAYAIYKNQ